MAAFPHADKLLRDVQRRLAIRTIAHRAFVLTLIFSGVYCLLLLTGRLTGLFPNWFSPWSVAVVPGLSLLAATVFGSRPQMAAAAHAVDRFSDTKDLFLTVISLEKSPCEYSPLVGRDAEKSAGSVPASKVVPFHWEHPSLVTAGALAVLVLGAFFVPTLDPFGSVAEAKQGEQERKLLEETHKQTIRRRAELKEKHVAEENSEEVEKAVEKLKGGLQRMERADRKKNQARLNEHQKELGEKFRKLNSGELRSLFDQAKGEQKLGMLHDEDLFRKWQRELQQGSADNLQQELKELKDALKEMAKADDPVAKTELERKIKQKLKEMKDFANNKVGSKALMQALDRAMEQLDAAKNQELSREAMEALEESMELASEELQLLAQASRDLESLEEALELISMCKKCNAEGELDGEMFDGQMSLEEYAEMYAQLMAQMQGQGTGGQGMGDSESVPEDDSIETGFKDEKSKSAIQKGRILLSMKTKGISEAGEMKEEEYRRVVGELKQSLEDVIDQEQIPPGYVEGIKKYFDTLEKKTP